MQAEMKFYPFVVYRNTMYLADGAFNTPQEAIERAKSLEVASKLGAFPNTRGSRKGPQDVIDVITGDCWIETGKTMKVVTA